jgi:hypothetical protein
LPLKVSHYERLTHNLTTDLTFKNLERAVGMRNIAGFFTVSGLLILGPIAGHSTTHSMIADRSEVAISSFGKISLFFGQRRYVDKGNSKVGNTSNKPEIYRPPDNPGFNRDFGG